MPKQVPTFISLALSTILVVLSSDVIAADNDCEALPPGPARTDCFILKGRVHGLKSSIAADKARQAGNAAKLETQKGEEATPDSAKQRQR